MKCPECGEPLFIANSKFESDEGSTDVYSVLTMVCINNKKDPVTKKNVCSLYCGPDTNGPNVKAAEIVRRKVN